MQKKKKLTQIWEFSGESKFFKCSEQNVKWHKTKASKKVIPGEKKPTKQKNTQQVSS